MVPSFLRNLCHMIAMKTSGSRQQFGDSVCREVQRNPLLSTTLRIQTLSFCHVCVETSCLPVIIGKKTCFYRKPWVLPFSGGVEKKFMWNAGITESDTAGFKHVQQSVASR